MARLFANENIARSTVEVLRKEGFETTTVLDEGLQGVSDEEIVQHASRHGLTIVTLDHDFGRIFVERVPAVQIVLVRPAVPLPDPTSDILLRFLTAVDLDDPAMKHDLFVVTSAGYRRRARA